MKGLKSLRLPSCIIKDIPYGKENEELMSMLVDLGVFFLLGIITFFVYNPIEDLSLKIVCIIGDCLFTILLGYWLIVQVALLDSLRKEALLVYKNSKTEDEIAEANLRLKKLWVPIPTAA